MNTNPPPYPITLPTDLRSPRTARQHVADDREDDVLKVVERLVSDVVTTVLRCEHPLAVDVRVDSERAAVTVTIFGGADGRRSDSARR